MHFHIKANISELNLLTHGAHIQCADCWTHRYNQTQIPKEFRIAVPSDDLCVLGDFCEVLLRFGPVSPNCLTVLGSQPLAVALTWVPSESPGELMREF